MLMIGCLYFKRVLLMALQKLTVAISDDVEQSVQWGP